MELEQLWVKYVDSQGGLSWKEPLSIIWSKLPGHEHLSLDQAGSAQGVQPLDSPHFQNPHFPGTSAGLSRAMSTYDSYLLSLFLPSCLEACSLV